jgi:hypothetical protein
MSATGTIWIVFGLVVVIGQFISSTNFAAAQRFGFQEKDASTDPLFRRLELNTARWDLVVWWVLPVTGGLVLLDHPWWPLLALVAGGISIDTAGRETAKVLGLMRNGIKTGTTGESRVFFGFLGVMLLVGVWCVVLGFAALI